MGREYPATLARATGDRDRNDSLHCALGCDTAAMMLLRIGMHRVSQTNLGSAHPSSDAQAAQSADAALFMALGSSSAGSGRSG